MRRLLLFLIVLMCSIGGLDAQFRLRFLPEAALGEYGIADGSATCTGNAPPNNVDSPTGRNPRFLITCERRAVFLQMKADYEANPSAPTTNGGKMYKRIKEKADAGTSYSDGGEWAAWMYQVTGTASYATTAWTNLNSTTNGGSAGFIALASGSFPFADFRNYMTVWGSERVILLDWLWPALTTEQRTTYITSIADSLTELVGPSSAFTDAHLQTDTDLLTGTYFVTALAKLNHPGNTVINTAWTTSNTAMGGLTTTAADYTSYRNEMNLLCSVMGAGGEWMESTEYNLGTVTDLMMGLEAIYTHTGVEYFSECRTFLEGYGEGLMGMLTPDLRQLTRWGDIQQPHHDFSAGGARLFDWGIPAKMAAGLLQGTTVGQRLQSAISAMIAAYGLSATDGTSLAPYLFPRDIYTFNPYATESSWTVAANQFHSATGPGLLQHKSGFASTDSLFFAFWSGRAAAAHFEYYGGVPDHSPWAFGDFTLYRNHEWVIDHPQGYDAPTNNGPIASDWRCCGGNAPSMQGFGLMREYAKPPHIVQAAGYSYAAGTTGGGYGWDTFYDPPPIFVHEWTREQLFVPGASGSVDTVIIYDRAHVLATVDQVGLLYGSPDRYGSGTTSSYKYITLAEDPKHFILHTPVSPTFASGAYTWMTAGGQSVKWTPLLPASPTKRVIDESTLGGNWSAIGALKYHVKIAQASHTDFSTFLNVIQAGTAGTVVLTSDGTDAECAHVTTGGNDILACFNATASAALNTTAYHASHAAALDTVRYHGAKSFTIAWTASAATTTLFFSNLRLSASSAGSWTKNVDGAGAGSISPDSGGWYTTTVSGTGAHSIVVAGS